MGAWYYWGRDGMAGWFGLDRTQWEFIEQMTLLVMWEIF